MRRETHKTSFGCIDRNDDVFHRAGNGVSCICRGGNSYGNV